MRLSAIVSVLVVTASFALGGCAADAEPTTGSGTPDQPNVALSGTDNSDGLINDVGQQGNRYSDNFANPSDEARARRVNTYVAGEANPRIDVQPSPFGLVNTSQIGVQPSVFNPKSNLEVGAALDTGYTPYVHKKP
jgi:hypothetical protein